MNLKWDPPERYRKDWASPFAPLPSKTTIYLRCRVPTAMRQADKVKALVEAGVQRVQVQEQLGISKASYYRCLKAS